MATAVLASGGVDSSVALATLCRQGCREITAFYLKIWLEDDLHFLGDCPWGEDLKYVRALCRQLKVPLEVVPLQAEYRERVVQLAIDELRAGRTPSPDIWCNQFIKFGEFFKAIDTGYETVATGHYAQVEQREGLYWLKRSPDPVKDQSYFLVRLDQAQLARACFPVGHLVKSQVRALARELDVPAKDRKDSQGICFLGKIPYREFVRYHLGVRRGPIVEAETGRKLGEHDGFWFYTIGQRQGLGLSGGPWYVVQRIPEDNVIVVSHREHVKEQARRELIAVDVRWIAAPPSTDRLQAKLRHGPKLIDCRIEELGADRLRVKLAEPDPGIAAGQWVILYDREYCLGGGMIE